MNPFEEASKLVDQATRVFHATRLEQYGKDQAAALVDALRQVQVSIEAACLACGVPAEHCKPRQ